MKYCIQRIGRTVLGQSIDCWYFTSEAPANKILILGGVHGDEAEGIEIANNLLKHLIIDTGNNSFAVIPILNKDGETLVLRSNFNDVDLNRNIPTTNWVTSFVNPRYRPGHKPASEPETIAFLDILESFSPSLIISLHSFSESLILYNPGSGRFDVQVAKLGRDLDLKIVDKMPYEVVGSLNTYCKEKVIPLITIEAPRNDTWESKKDLFIQCLTQFLIKA